ncbi:MAG TPA: twin-arginine translocase TatA/TatE family subunit [Pyrinomonadaceae bacterium]|nr:twin-arginine translocase TatA/TatE family subunit [Pyrinomonadaceae bacterium]
MFLFIFESIGTSELILIGLVALIIFGPRKLPQIAKTIGKTMADFRRTTQDFKSTWEREVDFEEEKTALKRTFEEPEKTISNVKPQEISQGSIETNVTPEIKEISAETFQLPEAQTQTEVEKKTEEVENTKQNWL